ncbi:hypothetical protein ES708_26428 [subsurface metagenome]
MPIMKCRKGNKPGYRWGNSGFCYTYEAGNKASESVARLKAAKQGAAIHVSSGEKFKP